MKMHGKQRRKAPKRNSQRKIEGDISESENAKAEDPARSQWREGAPNERLRQHPGKAADLVVCGIKRWIKIVVAISNVHPFIEIGIFCIYPILI